MNRDTLKRFNKNFRKYLIKHKVPLIASIAILLFACVSIYISYAFYQNVGTQNIIGGSVGDIPDIEIRVMAQERDANGNATNKFSIYPYIPRAGYRYNAAKSYCSNGGVLVYDGVNYKATVEATGHDLCYIYFDSIASLDVTLNVYTENIDTNGVGQGTFTKLETSDLPSIGYSFNKTKSSCTNGSTLAYSDKDNIFTVEASGKDTCNAYMNAMDVDIASVLYFQAKAGSTLYHKASQVPANNYYELNTSKSSCTGTSTLSIENQKVIINATSKTKCVAYLDVAVGPIVESVQAIGADKAINLTFKPNSAGSIITKYFYSIDNGATFKETTATTAQITGLETLTNYTVLVYGMDGTGKKSAILSVNATTTYAYNGTFPYQTTPHTKTIEVTGYYYLQVWGAQGGLTGGSNSGFGGYSKGFVHLNKNDVIYVYIGGAGTGPNTSGGFNGGGSTRNYGGSGGGGTDIRINQNSLYARVIVAGGGGGLGHANTPGGYGGGASGGQGGNGSATGGYGATQSSGGTNNTAGSFGTANSNSNNGGGGGGGWYGGASGMGSGTDSGGGGGSGYVYNASTVGSYPSGCLLNSSYYLTNAVTYGGNVSFESQNNGSETGHPGNGYAKVTYIGDTLN